MMQDMMVEKGYGSNEYLVKRNRIARFGAWVNNRTGKGTGIAMFAGLGCVVAIFSMGMPLDFLIIDPHPHYIIGTIIMSITGVPLFTSWLLGAAVLYARWTADDGRCKHYLAEVEARYHRMDKHERQLVNNLRDNMWNHRDNTTLFHQRKEKFDQIYSVLESQKQDARVDDSDIREADVLLELMRERKQLV